MRKAGEKNKRYSPEFKISVIMDMREHHLSYHETMRKHFPELKGKNYAFVQRWERIFLEEGAEGLMRERRGRACKADGVAKGHPPKPEKNDLFFSCSYRIPFKKLSFNRYYVFCRS